MMIQVTDRAVTAIPSAAATSPAATRAARLAALAAFGALLALQCTLATAQTPEQEKMWAAERAEKQAEMKTNAERLAKQREARKADPMAWVHTLDPMSAGGWMFRAVAPDGSWATFSTDHQLKRTGHTITIWLRQEYPEAQKSSGGTIYLSNVEKLQYDCAKERARALMVIYYAENNLAGSQDTEEADAKQAVWDPIVPGTQSETVFQWACAAGQKGHEADR